jgi:hypothetical protein
VTAGGWRASRRRSRGECRRGLADESSFLLPPLDGRCVCMHVQHMQHACSAQSCRRTCTSRDGAAHKSHSRPWRGCKTPERTRERERRGTCTGKRERRRATAWATVVDRVGQRLDPNAACIFVRTRAGRVVLLGACAAIAWCWILFRPCATLPPLPSPFAGRQSSGVCVCSICARGIHRALPREPCARRRCACGRSLPLPTTARGAEFGV